MHMHGSIFAFRSFLFAQGHKNVNQETMGRREISLVCRIFKQAYKPSAGSIICLRFAGTRHFMNRKAALLALMNLEGINRSGIRPLISALEASEFRNSDDLRSFLVEINLKDVSEANADIAWRAGKAALVRSSNMNIQVIAPWEKQFPLRLQAIPDSPLMLFARGNIDCLNAKMSAAIIGTREPTSFGIGSAFRISSYLSGSGVCIVSGLAKGCDTQGHLGCLSAGGQTVAVMATGLDQVYPAENGSLAQKILNNNGCLVSEYEPGTKPSRLSFIQRDRIQSGLSDVTIVIETGVKGGTLHTASFCLQQGKMLAVVSHPAKYQNAEKVQGNKMLINKKGAIPICDRNDIEKKVLEYLLSSQNGEPRPPWTTSEQLTMQLK